MSPVSSTRKGDWRTPPITTANASVLTRYKTPGALHHQSLIKKELCSHGNHIKWLSYPVPKTLSLQRPRPRSGPANQALGFQETVPKLAITVFTYMRPRVYASIAVAHKWFLHVYICAQGLTNE